MKKLLFVILAWTLGVLGMLIPRKPGLVVFSQARNRYSGNSRALFEWMARNDHQAYWLYARGFTPVELPEASSRFVARAGLAGFLLCARAEFAIISHGGSDFGIFWPLAKRARVIMLWHAIGIKRAGLTDHKATPAGCRERLRETRFYSMCIASSDIDCYNTAAFQGVDVRRVSVTGLPRADVYLHNRESGITHADRFKVLYAPTFRDYDLDRPLFFPFDDLDDAALRGFFVEQPDMEIHLRPHPNDTDSNIQAEQLAAGFPDNIKLLTEKIVGDVDSVLHQYEAIVTDYSSIYMEPLLADVPPIFVNFDLREYLSTRGMAYDYDLVTPGPKVGSTTEMLKALSDARRGAPGWAEHREQVRKMFFTHRDANACSRVFDAMKTL